jgi:hypothetical protein
MIGLLGGETVLQLGFVSDFRPLGTGYYRHKTDDLLGWVPIPNAEVKTEIGVVRNNSLGFRGAEFKRDGRTSITFLGDSFVWGYGLARTEDRFTERIQRSHPEWNIQNIGVISYGTDQELLLLKRVWHSLHPNLVFLLFCVENDHKDNSCNDIGGTFKPYFTTNASGLQLHGVPVPRSERAFCAEHPILSHSCLFRLAVRVWKRYSVPPSVQNDDPTLPLLNELNNFVRTNNAKLVVGLTGSDASVEQMLTATGIAWLDLSTTNRIPGDSIGHWTEPGHKEAAEKIQTFLEAELEP